MPTRSQTSPRPGCARGGCIGASAHARDLHPVGGQACHSTGLGVDGPAQAAPPRLPDHLEGWILGWRREPGPLPRPELPATRLGRWRGVDAAQRIIPGRPRRPGDSGGDVGSARWGAGSRGVPLRLLRLLQRWKPDVLHAHMVHANLLARLTRPVSRTPVLISTIHNENEGSQWRYRAYGWTHRLSDVTTAVSRRAVDESIRRGAAPAGGVVLVPNGISIDAYRPDLSVRRTTREGTGADGRIRLAGRRPRDRGQGLSRHGRGFQAGDCASARGPPPHRGDRAARGAPQGANPSGRTHRAKSRPSGCDRTFPRSCRRPMGS